MANILIIHCLYMQYIDQRPLALIFRTLIRLEMVLYSTLYELKELRRLLHLGRGK